MGKRNKAEFFRARAALWRARVDAAREAQESYRQTLALMNGFVPVDEAARAATPGLAEACDRYHATTARLSGKIPVLIADLDADITAWTQLANAADAYAETMDDVD